MGKLLRQGFEFHFTNHGKDCYGYTPGRSAKLRVELGLDGMLRLPHKLREGVDSIPLPTTNDSASVIAVRRTLSDLDAHFLHDLFNHSGMERTNRTIMATQGYTTKRFHGHHCASCAIAKARREGPSHSKNMYGRPKIASDRSDIKNITFPDGLIPKVQDDFSDSKNAISGRTNKEILHSDMPDTEIASATRKCRRSLIIRASVRICTHREGAPGARCRCDPACAGAGLAGRTQTRR